MTDGAMKQRLFLLCPQCRTRMGYLYDDVVMDKWVYLCPECWWIEYVKPVYAETKQ